jgi:hypothetical protein
LVWNFFSGKNLKLVESAELVCRSFKLEAGVNESWMMSDEKDRVKRNGISFTVNAEWEGGEVQVVAGGLGVT